jgi:hypothetical protein
MTIEAYWKQEFLRVLRDLVPDPSVAGLLAESYANAERALERAEQDTQRAYRDLAARLPKVAAAAGMSERDVQAVARQLAERYDQPLATVIMLLQTFYSIRREQPPAEKRPGVVLHLYHGRAHPSENMEEWGADGPRIACLCFGFTYDTLWIILPDEQRIELHRMLDCIEWEGVYYGDFEVISAEEADRPGSVVQQHPA